MLKPICLWLGLLLTLAGCSGPGPSAPEVDLDEALTALLTHDGQRPLAVFKQPASDNLGAIPQDPRNPLTEEKIRLGQLLFHETALGTRPAFPEGAGTYGCVTCHHAAAGFQAGRRQSIGDGGSGWGMRGEGRVAAYQSGLTDTPMLRSPSVLNGAFRDVMHWDGSIGATGQNAGTDAFWSEGTIQEVNRLGYDGLESQAIAALGRHRMDGFEGSVIETNPEYQALWQAVYPGQPVDRERVGLAIAAFERTLFSNRAPFQRWLAGDTDAMTADEKRGALVFFGESGCETCHTGPALAGPGFYALGMPDMSGADVVGPAELALGRGGFLNDPAKDLMFKVPQLYNLIDSPFMGHGGTFEAVEEVVRYYNEGVPAVQIPVDRLEGRFRPLHLTDAEVQALTVFLRDALRDPDLTRYQPSQVPSGNCFPANDAAARRDLGCD